MKKNGNITRQRRCGLVDNVHGSFELVDNLSMTYVGNMLTSVCDSASRYSYAGATDFDGVLGQVYPLTYNASGEKAYLGSSNPSSKDYGYEQRENTGSTFVVGQRNKTVQYYHNGKNTISMSWEQWKKLSGLSR